MPAAIWCSVQAVNLRPQAPILLVDDEPANLLALEAVLQELGEPLVRAASGAQALRQLRDQDFAAVLLDVRMPGMDGFEAARLIRAQRRSRATPIIFITAGDPSAVAIEQAYALGAIDYLSKPLMPTVLKAKVAFFVQLHRSKQELQAAEKQAVQDRAFLSAVLEAVEDGIVACGPDGKLTLFNRATREFHGLALQPLGPEQWAGRHKVTAGEQVADEIEHYPPRTTASWASPSRRHPKPAASLPRNNCAVESECDCSRVQVAVLEGRSGEA
jgi:CheY-like chemotaxis protein